MMNKPFRRERRSPDLHSVRQKTPEKRDAYELERSEWYSRGYLPLRNRNALAQHVSVHLADCLPQSAIEKIDIAIKNLPDSRRKLIRRKRMDSLIDAGHGSCVLAIPEIAAMVQETLLYFHQQRYYLNAWVVMPNHFHSLFQPINGWSMAKIVSSWKKFTARKIRDYLREASKGKVEGGSFADREIRVPGNSFADQEICAPGGAPGGASGKLLKSGPVWYSEYWDRYIRDEGHYLDTVEYIHNNPVKPGTPVTRFKTKPGTGMARRPPRG
jgi:REP element-mobilizing transposase RayT